MKDITVRKKYTVSSKYESRLYINDNCEVLLFLRGDVRVSVNGRNYTPEPGDMRRIIARYGRAGRRIALIGHSWGASTLALDVLAHPACRGVPVDALVTLDPVGVRGPRFLLQVRRWLNVYLPYDLAAWSRENNVARLGRPWEQVAQAGLNRVPSQLRHADARGMFREFGTPFLDMIFSFEGLGGRA
ncbi:alpha/beta fold hydrolase [uncultured Mailhella sp.]|uniref:alpha/beta fold hydrolase n=1 Tax=uncultured Mailhella sp. TaxID=1981031 RepID=UPI002634DF95|nr:alpha/beta fold hydrolase [uncultured Mailhella sp.]